MHKDLYERGRPLKPAGLFQLVTDEALKDGIVDPAENRVLSNVAKFLRLEPKTAHLIARLSLEKHRQGQLRGEGTLDPMALYQRVLSFARSDGQMDQFERAMLTGLQTILQISSVAEEELSGVFEGVVCAAPPEDLGTACATLKAALQKDLLPEDAQTRAATLAKRVAEVYQGGPDTMELSLRYMIHLAPVLVRTRQGDQVERILSRILASGGESTELSSSYDVLVQDTLTLGPTGTEGRIQALELFSRLAQVEPQRPYRWLPLADACHRVSRIFFEEEHLDAHTRVLELLSELPQEYPAVAARWLRTRTDSCLLALAQAPARGATALKELLNHVQKGTQNPVLRTECARALCMLAQNVPYKKAPKGFFAEVLAPLAELVTKHTQDRELVSAFWKGLAVALPPLVVERNEGEVLKALEALKMLPRPTGGDEPTALAVARGLMRAALVQAALKRAGSSVVGKVMSSAIRLLTKDRDPVLKAMQSCFELMAASWPRSDGILLACGRFERATGLTVTLPANARVPAPPHPDVEALWSAFEMQQATGADAELNQVVARTLNQSAPQDERYYLALVRELDRQIESDRMGYWSARRSQADQLLSLMTRGGTAGVTKAAEALKRRFA